MQLDLEPIASTEVTPALAIYRHPLEHFRDLAVAENVIEEKGDMGELRRFCLENGMTRAGWRFLNRWGKDAYAAILPLVENSQNPFEITSLYVTWQCNGGMKKPIAGELGRRVISCMGDYYHPEITMDPRIAKAADEHLHRLRDPDERLKLARHDWMRVITWVNDINPGFDRNQWRSGWKAIYRNYQKWKKLNPAANAWQSALPAFDEGDFHIQPLTSSYELAREGYRMQHCVSTYGTLCLAGKYRLFSVSEISSGKRLVTIGLRREGDYWRIEQIKGRFNRDPMLEPARLGLLIQRRYAQAEEHLRRQEIMKHRRRKEHLRAMHDAYRRKRFKVPNEIRDQLNDEDAGFLEREGAWLEALATGKLQPNEFPQVRFIAVTRGIVRPRTESERTWVRYRRASSRIKG